MRCSWKARPPYVESMRSSAGGSPGPQRALLQVGEVDQHLVQARLGRDLGHQAGQLFQSGVVARLQQAGQHALEIVRAVHRGSSPISPSLERDYPHRPLSIASSGGMGG
jgi:hypothetical protein